MTLVDARGVEISPGDVALYGFGVGRSIAMAEAVVLGETDGPPKQHMRHDRVSLTPSGRVRLRVVRRSYDSGTKPIVDVAPDRLVVLKEEWTGLANLMTRPSLPPSPLPTQDDEARVSIQRMIDLYVEHLRKTVAPDYWTRDPEAADPEALALAEYHSHCAKELGAQRRKMKALDE